VSKVIELSRGESRVEVAVASTSGVRCCESGTISSSGASVMAAKGSEVQVGSGMSWARFQDALEPSRAGRDAVLRAVSLLGARKPPSRRRSVLWDPWIAGDFLDIVAGALSAEAVQRGRSLFQGKLGARVASPLVTFVDDPRRPGGMASFLRDDEGMPTSRKEMVKDGILMDFFFDSYTARKAGRLSNGCATRSGYKGLPGPGSSNFFLAPGVSRREDLIAGTRDGILAFELLGMHTADPISGEFSAGVGGIAIEGGELAYPVKNAMISGNVVDLLSRVDAVCGDLTFHGCLAAPTFRVADVMVC
jgi:PmbA protein